MTSQKTPQSVPNYIGLLLGQINMGCKILFRDYGNGLYEDRFNQIRLSPEEFQYYTNQLSAQCGQTHGWQVEIIQETDPATHVMYTCYHYVFEKKNIGPVCIGCSN